MSTTVSLDLLTWNDLQLLQQGSMDTIDTLPKPLDDTDRLYLIMTYNVAFDRYIEPYLYSFNTIIAFIIRFH
jgi:hypothetical protein